MNKFRLKKGDKVVVISGEEKGKTGDVSQVFATANRVLIDGLNQVKRHVKAGPKNPEGGVALKSLPLDASNVMMVDPKTEKPTRVGKKWIEGKKDKKGHWARFAKGSGELID